MQRQVTLAKNQLRDLQTSNESTQAKLLNHSERQGKRVCHRQFHCLSDGDLDQEVVAKLAEMDFIVADLERANSRVAAVERRNVRFVLHSDVSLTSCLQEILRAEIEAVRSGNDSSNRYVLSSMS